MKQKLGLLALLFVTSLACSSITKAIPSGAGSDGSGPEPAATLAGDSPSIEEVGRPGAPGVYLLDAQGYIELQQYEGLPEQTAAGIPDSRTSSPVLVIWVPGVQPQYLSFIPWGLGYEGEIAYSRQTLDSDLVQITVEEDLDAGEYCLVQGDPQGSPYSLPTWCFRIPAGVSSDRFNQGYAWRAFPIRVVEDPGKGNQKEAGWKYLVVDFGVVNLGEEQDVGGDFKEAVKAMTLVNDAGYSYAPFDVDFVDKGVAAVQAYEDEGKMLNYVCENCFWLHDGFVLRSWVAAVEHDRERKAGDPYPTNLDYPQFPMHVVFRVPETSLSYQLTIPTGTAMEPAQFDLSPAVALTEPSYPFVDPSKQQIYSTGEAITFESGVLTIDQSYSAQNELLVDYSFKNASAGYGASGGAYTFVVDDHGAVYEVLDWRSDRTLQWEAGPSQSVSGTVAFPLPPDAGSLWLAVRPYKTLEGGRDLEFEIPFVFVSLPAPRQSAPSAGAPSIKPLTFGETPALDNLALEKYSGQDFMFNTDFTYTVSVGKSDEVIWAWNWCTANNQSLRQNMDHIQVEFIMDGQKVPAGQVNYIEFEDSSLNTCGAYYVGLADWSEGYIELVNRVTFDELINDGWSDYPAQTRVYTYRVTVDP